MRLQRIALRGFQSYSEEQAVDIDRHITLLAGRNNVGKSALLRALQSTVEPQQGAASDFRLSYTWVVTLLDHVGLRAAQSHEVIDWLLAAGDDQHLTVAYVGHDADGSVQPASLRVDGVALPDRSAKASGQNSSWDLPIDPTPVHDGALSEMMRLARNAADRVLYIAPRRVDKGLRYLSPMAHLTPDSRNLAEVLLNLQLADRFGTFAEVESLMRAAFPA